MQLNTVRIALLAILFSNAALSMDRYTTSKDQFIAQRARLIQLSGGFLVSRALQVFAELRIADHLKEGPHVIDDAFALQVGADRTMLYRLLRMLAGHGIVQQQEDNTFSLTPLGELIKSDHPATVANFLRMEDETRWRSYGNLLDTLKTGIPAFTSTFGENYFDYIAKDAGLQQRFDDGMHDISSEENMFIAQSLNFKDATTIVDVGGGTGGLLLALKQQYSSLGTTILFDYTNLTPEQHKLLKTQTITFVQGSFFDEQAIPAGKDIYILKRVLHDWDTAKCIRIVKRCREAMAPNSKLYIIDALILAGNNYHVSKDIDLMMMTLFGGQERTQVEFEEILKAADMRLVATKPIESSMLSILEARLA
ncbi:SAM-dependent methyltransferase [Candidatus Dependentiae bacterium]|nr:SAM-dependent methyltransferase [Candidatus Dependentiae bacterium]